MTWQDVAIAAISSAQVIALSAIAVAMERSRRESSKRHAQVIEAVAANGDSASRSAPDSL